jgi:hypothetical protein
LKSSPFQKQNILRENRKQKRRVDALLTDTLVNVELEAEEETQATPLKCNRFLSGSQDNSRKSKQL